MKSLTNSSTVSTENIKTLFQHNYYESILVVMFVVLELTDSQQTFNEVFLFKYNTWVIEKENAFLLL